MSTSRLDDLRMVDPVLTTVAQGYSNASMIAEALFPIVSVPKIKGKIPIFGRDAFIVRDTSRAIRAQSNRIPPSDVDLVTFETRERDVETSIDYIEEEESPDFFRYEQKLAKQLVDILELGREKEIADYVQNISNYPIGLVKQITSQEAFDNYTLTIDPIAIIRLCMTAVRTRIGKYPNTMVMGDEVFQALLQHPKILDRIKYSGVSKANSQILGELTDISDISIGLGVYSTDGASFTDIWRDNIILAYVDKNDKISRSEFNPSFGYIFQREGKPEIDTYYENGGKIKVIRNTDNLCFKVTAPDAAFIISDCCHPS